jgi:hypothetical protein
MHIWIEGIVESAPTPSFFINFRINMANFMDPHKMVVRKNAFSALPKCMKCN